MLYHRWQWLASASIRRSADTAQLLLYGASGVGKSSLLDAGLLPRLDRRLYEVRYARRDPKAGLVGSLCEALNHALRNIPEEQIRYHLCWGSWHGPHSADLPLADIVDIMLSIKAQTYSIEAANVRHEHEVELWRTTKLPDGKMLAPGVVTHSTPLIEHPQLVANRIQRFAEVVGRENVIASTDCGLGLRLHPSLAWANSSCGT